MLQIPIKNPLGHIHLPHRQERSTFFHDLMQNEAFWWMALILLLLVLSVIAIVLLGGRSVPYERTVTYPFTM